MKTRSIRFKTNILYSSILCGILIFFSLYLFHTVRQILYDELKEDMKVKAGQIRSVLNAYASISMKDNSSKALMSKFQSASGGIMSDTVVIDLLWLQNTRTLGLKNDLFRILSPQGLVLFSSENMTKRMEDNFNTQYPKNIHAASFTNLQFNGKGYYGINYPFNFSDRNAFILQLATPLISVHRILSKLAIFIVGGIVAMLLMTLSMGSFLTRRILKPVTDVTQAADNITQKNLNLRIPEQALDQEMEELVRSFNRMIERLERSFSHVNEFSSHVAHELRTPLAIIKSELELALASKNTNGDGKRVMKVTLGEADKLIRTIKDLLFLSKLEYKLNIFNMVKIDIVGFLNEIYQHSKVLAAEKKIRTTLIAPALPVFINGDTVHLRRVFFNLIHNAVKFTPPEGEITILAAVQEKQVFVSIKDTGIGIAAAHQHRIFEKFYRVRRADQEDACGNGLGLSMARAVARSHGGDINFKSEINKGSVFTVVLPVVSD